MRSLKSPRASYNEVVKAEPGEEEPAPTQSAPTPRATSSWGMWEPEYNRLLPAFPELSHCAEWDVGKDWAVCLWCERKELCESHLTGRQHVKSKKWKIDTGAYKPPEPARRSRSPRSRSPRRAHSPARARSPARDEPWRRARYPDRRNSRARSPPRSPSPVRRPYERDSPVGRPYERHEPRPHGQRSQAGWGVRNY